MSIIDRLKRLLGAAPTDESPSADDGVSAQMLSCEEALRLVHEFIDGELEDVSAQEVQKHFDMCQRCYPHLQLESTFREALRRAARGSTAPADLRDRLTAMIAEERGEK